mgnify:CR=1 FL=1
MFGISTLNRHMRAALRATVGSLRGARWDAIPTGALVRLSNGRVAYVTTWDRGDPGSPHVDVLSGVWRRGAGGEWTRRDGQP